MIYFKGGILLDRLDNMGMNELLNWKNVILEINKDIKEVQEKGK